MHGRGAGLGGRVAVVTGAASGSGRATAGLLARLGAQVVLADRNLAGAREAAAEILAEGGQAEPFGVDVSDPRLVAALAAHVHATHGRVDVVHNSAALTDPAHQARDRGVLDLDLETWERTLEVDLTGTALVCQAMLPLMFERGGSIINVSSNAGLAGGEGLTAYSVAKAGIHQLSRAIATTYGRFGIRCNALSPGHVASPSFLANVDPATSAAMRESCLLPRLGDVADIARAASFLASDASAAVTGQVLRVDGGALAHLATYAQRRPPQADDPRPAPPGAGPGMAAPVAIVTAASAEVPRACAWALASAGANVVVVDHPGARTEVDALGHAIRAAGGQAWAVAIDLRQPGGAAELADRLPSAWGPPRTVVDGEAARGPQAAVGHPEGRLAVVVSTGELAGAALAGAGGGAIVHLVEAGALAGDVHEAGDGLLGGAVASWSRALGARFGPAGVRSNVVVVGERDEVARHSTLLPVVPTAGDVAAVVAFLASDDASFITGITLPVDGGQSAHLPHLGRLRSTEHAVTPTAGQALGAVAS